MWGCSEDPAARRQGLVSNPSIEWGGFPCPTPKLKESRTILAYPYCRPLGELRRARGDALPGRRRSRAPRFGALRPLRKTSVWLVFIGVHRRPILGFRLRVGPKKKHIWPPMNADNPEVLRFCGSGGVAGISTFMSRTHSPVALPGAHDRDETGDVVETD